MVIGRVKLNVAALLCCSAQSPAPAFIHCSGASLVVYLIFCHLCLGRFSSSTCVLFRWRRYVCEDRFTAIRWAIATAQKGDVVVVAGKGDQDWTEVGDGRGGHIRVGVHVLA